MPELENKTALVTGASRGIGRATATALAEAGAHVLVHYGRSKREAESVVSAIKTKGGRADALSADLELQMARRCSPSRFAQLLAIDWMCLCSTPESARRQQSLTTQ